MKKLFSLVLVLMLVVGTLALPAMAAAKTTITLDQKGAVTVNLNQTLQLNATVTPAAVTWKSSKKGVASVDGNGLVTACKEGTATITAKAGGKTAKVKVKVVDPKKPTKLTIGQGKGCTLDIDKTLALQINLLPDGAESELTFKSSKTSVATVDPKGVVTPKKEGTTKITVTSKKNKKVKATISVKVINPFKPTKVIISQGKNATLEAGSSLTLTTTLEPATAKADLIWKSSKSSVASVDGNGKITANKKGTAKITVTAKNNKKAKATFTVKVLAAPKPADGKDLSVCIGKNAKQVMDAYGLKQTGEKLQNGVTIYTLATDGIEMMAGGKSLDTATVYYLRVYGAAGAKFNIQSFNLTSMTYKQATAKAKKEKFTITYDNLFPDRAVLTTEKGDKRLIVYAKNRDSIVNQLVYRTKLDPK